MEFRDISAQTFGKYQFCTQAKDGMFYADTDFGPDGKPKHGALPSPWQRTPELMEKARLLHESSAIQAADRFLAVPTRRIVIDSSLWTGR